MILGICRMTSCPEAARSAGSEDRCYVPGLPVTLLDGGNGVQDGIEVGIVVLGQLKQDSKNCQTVLILDGVTNILVLGVVGDEMQLHWKSLELTEK